jgi:hypothetical protein
MNVHTWSRKGRYQRPHPQGPPLEDTESTKSVKRVINKECNNSAPIETKPGTG